MSETFIFVDVASKFYHASDLRALNSLEFPCKNIRTLKMLPKVTKKGLNHAKMLKLFETKRHHFYGHSLTPRVDSLQFVHVSTVRFYEFPQFCYTVCFFGFAQFR